MRCPWLCLYYFLWSHPLCSGLRGTLIKLLDVKEFRVHTGNRVIEQTDLSSISMLCPHQVRHFSYCCTLDEIPHFGLHMQQRSQVIRFACYDSIAIGESSSSLNFLSRVILKEIIRDRDMLWKLVTYQVTLLKWHFLPIPLGADKCNANPCSIDTKWATYEKETKRNQFSSSLLPRYNLFSLNLEGMSPFSGATDTLFWTSGGICPGFESQSGFPSLHASLPVCNELLRFTSGLTTAELSPGSNMHGSSHTISPCTSCALQSELRRIDSAWQNKTVFFKFIPKIHCFIVVGASRAGGGGWIYMIW